MEQLEGRATPPAKGILAPVAKALHLAPEGVGVVLGLAAGGLFAGLIGSIWPALAILILALMGACFFRDPERFPPRVGGVVLSGADGKVIGIGEGTLQGVAAARRFRRVSVFMSLLDVHVNRASVGGEIVAVEHIAGKFRAAFSDDVSEHNERNRVTLRDSAGRTHGLTQVAGYLARRIVCHLRPNDTVQAGERIGLIMFGSRVDHYLPPEYRVAVKLGQRVRAGESVIGELTDESGAGPGT